MQDESVEKVIQALDPFLNEISHKLPQSFLRVVLIQKVGKGETSVEDKVFINGFLRFDSCVYTRPGD